jgi:hypothetical protein
VWSIVFAFWVVLLGASRALAVPVFEAYAGQSIARPLPPLSLVTLARTLRTRFDSVACQLPSAHLFGPIDGLNGGELCFREGTLHLCLAARQVGGRDMSWGVSFSDAPDPCTKFDEPSYEEQ